MRNSVAPFLLFCLMSVSLVCAAQNGKVEAIALPPGPDLPQSVRQVLEPKGYRVALDDGSVACELWLRKSVPSQPKKDVQGAIHTELGESTLVGVLHFPQASTDYRGQAIPAGFYTLRYELLPNDGNHLGAAPNRDFLLLVSGQSVSSVGSQVSLLAFPLLMFTITHSAAQAGLMSALRSLPYAFFCLPAGALVDRWDRKRVMIFCDVGRALALGSIPLAFALGQLTLVQLYLVSLVEGTLFTFFSMAETA